MKVGLILPLGDEPGPGVPTTYAEISAMARDAEAGGLDSVWVYDHLPETWEAWTLLAALAAGTATVGLGTLVSCTSFRHPGLLAKMAHTVAEISGDRLTVGLGAGILHPRLPHGVLRRRRGVGAAGQGVVVVGRRVRRAGVRWQHVPELGVGGGVQPRVLVAS